VLISHTSKNSQMPMLALAAALYDGLSCARGTSPLVDVSTAIWVVFSWALTIHHMATNDTVVARRSTAAWIFIPSRNTNQYLSVTLVPLEWTSAYKTYLTNEMPNLPTPTCPPILTISQNRFNDPCSFISAMMSSQSTISREDHRPKLVTTRELTM
jgi:hypothetical protein